MRMSKVEFTGKVGFEYMTLLVDAETKTFHSAFYPTVEAIDGKMHMIHDADAPFKLMEVASEEEALQKTENYLKRGSGS
jgi:hypothetical protein